MPGSSPDAAAEAAVDDVKVQDAGTPAEGKTPDGTTADSSAAAAETPKKAETMLDAVKAALKPKAESPTAKAQSQPEADAAADGTKKPGETDADEDELSEDELKGLHGKVQKRFQRLTAKLTAKDQEIEGLSVKAKEYEKITGFIQSTGMNNAEVGELLTIGSLLKKGDHRAALTRIMPVVQALQKAAGEELSPELQERVRLGHLTEDDARALSRSSADAAASRRLLEKQEADAKAAREAGERQELVNKSLAAVETWEAAQAKSDPDWHLKRDEVAEFVELAIDRESRKTGKPYFPNAEEMLKLSKDGLEAVNKRHKRFAPKPKPANPGPDGASTRSKAAPKSMLDVINNGLSG